MLKRIRMFFVMLAALMLIAAPALAVDAIREVRTFDELKDAINKGESIKLLNDISGITEGLTLDQKNVVLDLNGKELSTSSDDFYGYGPFINVNGGSLSIDNSGTITSNKIFCIEGGGSLKITGPCTLKMLNILAPYIVGLDCSKGGNTLYISGNAKLYGASDISMIKLNTSKSYANNIFISNGEFHGVIDIEGYEKTPENFQITGGAFSIDPTKYLNDDYKAEKGADNLYHVHTKTPTPTPGPIDPAPKPVKPVIGNVPDDVKAEIKPELAVTEGDPAAAAKKIGGALTAEQLTRNKDGNTIVEPKVAVKAANKLGTLSSVTTKDVVALPVFTTPAIDANKDKTIMISYLILGSDLKAKKPADVKVMKILGEENGELFTYASAITKDMDKKFTVMKDDDSGTIFTGDIDGYTMYRLALFIKDGGKFDLDGKKDGAVADPTVILGAEKRASDGGSGGCNAGLGVLALLLSLAAIPPWYTKGKSRRIQPSGATAPDGETALYERRGPPADSP